MHNRFSGRIGPEQFLALLDELLVRTRALEPAPDAVVGIKRSGLFPAVFLSEQLRLPMFTDYEAQRFPTPRLNRPLVVDTVAWGGSSIRHTLKQLTAAGVEQAQVLVMFARAAPPPSLEAYAGMADQIRYLYQAESIPQFWYMH